MDVVEEESFFTDDVKLIADMLKTDWSLGPENSPNVNYEPSAFLTNARVGTIQVQKVSASNRISATDYQSVERTTNLSIRVSNPLRRNHFAWCEEVQRILLSNRRAHPKLGGQLFLEVTGERESNELAGWYVTTFEVKLTRFNKPIKSAGFGDRINKVIDDQMTNTGD